MHRARTFPLWVAGILLATTASALAAGPAEEAKAIAALTNFHGGLVVQVGCGDGQLTAALRLADNCTVQGLERDAQRVEAARAAIRQQGLYGPVSVLHWTENKLPYADHLATLVVCEDPAAVPADELLRIVRPFGAAAVKRNGQWTVSVQPQLPHSDQWQQHYHGPDNNAVAQDTVTGPPRRYQWLGYPEWQRSHLAMPSINSLVSSNGRLFTVEDLASAEHPALPGKEALVCRDAYNGVILWKVLFADWYPTLIRDKETPVQIQRRTAAVGDVVYCTPGYTAPITLFDAATGAVIKSHAATAGTMEFVYDRDALFTVVGDQFDVPENLADNQPRTAMNSSIFPRDAYGPRIKKPEHPRTAIAAVDAASGKELWKIPADAIRDYEGGTLGVIGDRVLYATNQELVCLDRASGKQQWRVPAPIVLKGPLGISVSLVLGEGGTFLADSQRVRAFDLASGKALWEAAVTVNHHKAPDVFVADGLVWTAAYDAGSGRPAPALGLTRMGVNGFDPRSGKLVKELNQDMTGPMGHDRCYRNRITTKYYINTATGGSDFLGLGTTAEFPNPWIRSTCGIGPLPCNGLYYAGPPSCSCCNSVMLNGLNALSTEPGFTRLDRPVEVATPCTLQKGPAFEEVVKAKPPATDSAADWPAYRHDAARTGTTSNQVPAGLVKRWEAKIGTTASPPVIAGGKVFAADVDGHSVCAINVADGKLAWRFTAEGRVDSPPACYQGLVLFGSRDGTVYCLRAADGALAWRFQPLERRVICAYGQPESAWPICGSLLVRDGLAYFAAGRNSFIDGGIFLYALEPRSGKIVHQKRMFGPYGENGFPVENREVVSGMSIEGFKGDVMLADDQLLFLRHQAFQPDLTPVKLEDVKHPHLIPSHGFLEAIPQHRSFWTIDTILHYDIPTGLGGIHGDILVIDGSKFYEVRGYPPGRTASFDPRTEGYTIFAGTYGGPAKPGADAKGGNPRRAAKAAAARSPAAKPGKFKKVQAQAKNQAEGSESSKVAPSEKLWAANIPLTGKAMALAKDVLFVAGTPVEFPENDLAKAYEGRMGGVLWAASAADGAKLAEYKLDAPPVWDSLAAADGLLFLSLADGRVICMGPK